jgi:chromosome segregation ATPase
MSRYRYLPAIAQRNTGRGRRQEAGRPEDKSLRPVEPVGPARFVRDEERQAAEAVSVSGDSLLDRIEEQAAALGKLQARLDELEGTSASDSETSRELAKALEAERNTRARLEAALLQAGQERDALIEQLAEKRTELEEAQEELVAASVQRVALETRVNLVWSQLKEAETELEQSQRRGLRRISRRDS